MAGSPALRGGVPSPRPTTVCQLKNQRSQSSFSQAPQAHAHKHPHGVRSLPPVLEALAFPSKGPKGEMTSGEGDRGQSLSTLPVASVLWGAGWQGAPPPSPHRAGRTAGSCPLQPQSAESMFPPEPRATGQSTGDTPQGREGWEGQGGPQAGALWPATLLRGLAVFLSGSLRPRQPQHVTAG